MNNESSASLPAIERIEVSAETLNGFAHEEDFTALAFDLLREVTSHVCVAASLLPGDKKAWNRDQAIIGGLLVRLFKMLCAVLDQTGQRRRETAFIFTRLAFECIVNIRYLVAVGSQAMFDAYVAYSLRHERRLLDEIHANIEARSGPPLPIESRMLRSIENAFAKSGVTPKQVTSSVYAPWKSTTLFDRAKHIGLEEAYLPLVGGASHSVHGNWQDLLEYHLDKSENGFTPDLAWHQMRPQVLFVLGVLTLPALEDHLVSLVGDAAAPVIEDFRDLDQRLRLADSAHERFLSERLNA